MLRSEEGYEGQGVGKEPKLYWIEVDKQIHAFILGDKSHPQIERSDGADQFIWRLKEPGYVLDTTFVLQDLEGEKEDSLSYHKGETAIVFGMMSLSRKKTIRIVKTS
ncbi:Pentatricopeptide repeat-containing protein [Camellia lanceoleosa]|uniref:Pentatricopeptide repeat-containing protein n=1 Tax=Camellia lanceoleosa TaxID=1840588 RepID=A0ACC0HF65_9ERIC|nr:Pentatricopeptide repeat-containing protein [Camellia lanceoleosa]